MNILKDCTTLEQHAHKCPNCDLVWDHDPSTVTTTRAFDDSHNCPRCGTTQGHIYDGDTPSQCCHNGVITEFYTGPAGPQLTARTRLLHEIADRTALAAGADDSNTPAKLMQHRKAMIRVMLSLCDITTCRLDFERLLKSSNEDFEHDIAGLIVHFSIDDKCMKDSFTPRCAR